jgi:hypothetical protein
VTFALRGTAATVEARCQELRLGREDSLMDANRAHERRSLSTRRDHARGTMTFTLEVPLEQGELIDKALDKARDAAGEACPNSRIGAGRSSRRMRWWRWRVRTCPAPRVVRGLRIITR